MHRCHWASGARDFNADGSSWVRTQPRQGGCQPDGLKRNNVSNNMLCGSQTHPHTVPTQQLMQWVGASGGQGLHHQGPGSCIQQVQGRSKRSGRQGQMICLICVKQRASGGQGLHHLDPGSCISYGTGHRSEGGSSSHNGETDRGSLKLGRQGLPTARHSGKLGRGSTSCVLQTLSLPAPVQHACSLRLMFSSTT